ncbi:peptidase M10A and M12B matrixin and adamalysin [Gemmatirosa kalamazoonensis]|uniref:Peptidase M10A and M12B matrixin and adamalysin n=1 Tax=Gemmatirosa kalamazoonensis TaxID=861299 RepID=W0RH36_9BACT|nr:matrixin family metalloprotease [Gemmatirosa kalamazoonensis]AHG89655.1 peptidase M10A and M12B matrixin and adamalysin [Gemmatirosa kalamazoonensis]
MKRIEHTLVALVGTLALFVGTESYRTAESAHKTQLSSSGTVAPLSPASPTVHRPSAAATAELPLSVRRMRRDDVRERLQANEAGTYIGEVLLDRDSALARWPDRVERPLRIWIGNGRGMPGWQPGFENEVRIAFNTWGTVGIPVNFELAPDSAHADVHVKWIDRFNEPISGKTVWSRDDSWWIVDGDITIALHHRDGDPLDAPQIRAIALHEIGHLLGLDHTTDPTNIMAPRVRVRELSTADQATIRLIYSVPAGKITG